MRIFCKTHFALTMPETLPFLWKLELLLRHCQATETCETLLQHLKDRDEGRYAASIDMIRKPSQHPSVESSDHCLRCQILHKKPRDLSEWSDEVQAAAVHALAAVIGCSPSDIDVIEVRGDPVRITLEMPEPAFERLLTLGQEDDPAFDGLSISHIKEIVTQPHNLDNIERMLDKMFTPAAFQEFCRRHFAPVCEQSAENSSKADMIATLLDHARQTSRIPHVLVFARQHNAKVYERYEPYHYPPRIYPSAQTHAAQRRAPTVLRQPLVNLTLGESVKAFAAGTGVAAALTFLVQRVLMIPVEDQTVAEVLQLVWGTTALFAIPVARAALWAANRNRGNLLAGISVAAYWLGMLIGNALVWLSSTGAGFQLDRIVPAIIYGLAMTISPLFSLSARMIVLIIGTYWAYHYAR